MIGLYISNKPSLVWFILPIFKESKQAHCAWALMARAVAPTEVSHMCIFKVEFFRCCGVSMVQ